MKILHLDINLFKELIYFPKNEIEHKKLVRLGCLKLHSTNAMNLCFGFLYLQLCEMKYLLLWYNDFITACTKYFRLRCCLRFYSNKRLIIRERANIQNIILKLSIYARALYK